MSKNLSKSVLVGAILGLSILSGCAELNDPYGGNQNGYGYPPPYSNGGYNNGGYNNGGYGYGGGRGYDDDYYRRRQHDRERREIDRERDRLEDERRRLEAERQRGNSSTRVPPAYRPPPPPPREERCPPGFSPSENKCSNEERKRGCKDMRLPGGLGCVRR